MSIADPAGELAFETEIAAHLAANGWLRSLDSKGYDRKRALYPEDLFAWLEETQPKELAKVVRAGSASEEKDRERLMDRLVQQLDAPMSSGGGTLNVLRQGLSHVNAKFQLCQFRPATSLNEKVAKDYQAVRLRVVQQVVYSAKPGNGSGRIDLVFFANGIPVATAELKTWFKQHWKAAVDQYKQDRDPAGEPLLGFGTRALVHFAIDDDEIWMTTKLAGRATHFLPFNKGTTEGGKGNPPNPTGHATSYLWEDVLERDSWLDILGKLMFVQSEGAGTEKSTRLLFPRFHQWDAVRKLTDAVRTEGTGHRYLVQHSAGSGKTNTIGWLAAQLSRLHDVNDIKVFSKVVIVSDRRILDAQLQKALLQIDPKAKDVIAVIDDKARRQADGSKRKALLSALSGTSAIVVVTIQSFPEAAKVLTETLPGERFAVIVDEAHSSQSGNAAKNLRKALAAGGIEVADDEDLPVSAEDVLDAQLAIMTKARAESPNISYFAFTATPKNKTMSLFGRRDIDDPDAAPRAFHVYSMRQAIEEGFILDVLRGYQSYKTAFKIEQNAKADEVVDSKAAMRGIMRYVTLHPTNIGQKVDIILEHFRVNVAGLLEGHAKAMVVTDSRVAAVKYKREIDKQIAKKGYDFKTIVAFSGKVSSPADGIFDATEHSMNPGVGADLAREFQKAEYRVMLVADKFQTGFDQPLLCAMYVDKKLEGVYAVQTLSRLNRTHTMPSGLRKDTTLVLDFRNEPEDILNAFQPYYGEAHVESETDPNIVHEVAAKLANSGIYTDAEVEQFAAAWYEDKGHAALSAAIKPAQKRFAEQYQQAKDDGDADLIDGLTIFRKDTGTFVRLYDFMSQVIDYGQPGLEKLAVFMRQLSRVIEVERLGTEVDISGIALKQIKQIDKGKATLLLGGQEADLGKGLGPGGGIVRPSHSPLREVIDKVNEMFGGEIPEDVIESIIRPILEKALAAKGVKGQIADNALDQFLNSSTLRDALVDASVTSEADIAEGMAKIVEAITGEGEFTDGLVQVLGTFLYEMVRGQKAGDASEQADSASVEATSSN